MPDQPDRPRLFVVGKFRRARVRAEDFQSPALGAQARLFAEPRPGMVIFVSFPEVAQAELLEVLTGAKPSLVVELRYSPRFDIGTLNRKAIFGVFEQVQARYVDLASSRMTDRDTSSLLRDVRELLERESSSLERPIAFLVSSRAMPNSFPERVIEVASSVMKGRAKEVLRIPQYTPA